MVIVQYDYVQRGVARVRIRYIIPFGRVIHQNNNNFISLSVFVFIDEVLNVLCHELYFLYLSGIVVVYHYCYYNKINIFTSASFSFEIVKSFSEWNLLKKVSTNPFSYKVTVNDRIHHVS